jgi:FAD/FMN-containing dehydrogenase
LPPDDPDVPEPRGSHFLKGAGSRSAEEIALMRTLKRTLDPKNLLNPGKVL